MMSETALTQKRRLTHADILPLAEYAAIRREERRRLGEIKRWRRLEVGPYSTFSFENWATMRHQVQEMLFIEKGGEAQIEDQLATYSPLIPNGRELVATVMFEIDDPVRRGAALLRLGGIEHRVFLDIDGERIGGDPDPTRENTSPEGKASAVQFLRFAFSREQIARFRIPGARIVAGIDHPNYAHMAQMPEAMRAALAEDFD